MEVEVARELIDCAFARLTFFIRARRALTVAFRVRYCNPESRVIPLEVVRALDRQRVTALEMLRSFDDVFLPLQEVLDTSSLEVLRDDCAALARTVLEVMKEVEQMENNERQIFEAYRGGAKCSKMS